MKNIIFDYDGTLHNSIKIYKPAFDKAYKYLVEGGHAKEMNFKDEEVSKFLGYSAKEMWNIFMPNLSAKEKSKCSSIIGNEMIRQIDSGVARLYEGTLDTLNLLKEKGYNLIFLSNCKIDYMYKHIETFNLDKYFNEFYCTEEFNFKPKYEIFEFISKEFDDEFIIVGDRYVDIEVAKKHNLFSIGCSYGFGSSDELVDSNVLINDIRDIVNVLLVKNI